MGEINVPRDEREALKSLDTDLLYKLIDQCIHEERPDALRALRLDRCGPYTALQLHKYKEALADYSNAKTAKKRTETEYRARRAGSNLTNAVCQMIRQMETDEQEGLLFYIDDQIRPPDRFSESMNVQVDYRWRLTTDGEWAYGSICISHNADSRPDYTISQPKRKPSTAKHEWDRQEKLYREWDHLMKLSLHSVRQYFRDGGNGAKIPQTFQAKADPYTRGLNNYSTDFWR